MNREPIPFAGWVEVGFDMVTVPTFSGLSKDDLDAADALTDPRREDYKRSNDEDN